MEFEIRISNDARALGLVEAFTTETLKHCPIERPEALHQLVLEATSHLVDEAYPEGQTGSIVLHSRQFSDHVEISIRDFGLPSDIAALEGATEDSTSWIGRFREAGAADSLNWSGYGPDGKALTIRKSFHDTHITAQGQAADLEPFSDQVPRAPEQDYTIRRMRPTDAVAISQLMFKAYGPTYFNRDVYYPERVAALNASDAIISFVAEGAQGRIVGHYALEKNQAGPVVEGGQAVVDPAHRGRHLLDRLKQSALDHARDLKLAGIYSDAVTVHRFTQKANVAAGWQLCCADVGISPQSEAFRGIAAPPIRQRVTCLMYFLPLSPKQPRVVHVPEKHRSIVSKIYANPSFLT